MLSCLQICHRFKLLFESIPVPIYMFPKLEMTWRTSLLFIVAWTLNSISYKSTPAVFNASIVLTEFIFKLFSFQNTFLVPNPTGTQMHVDTASSLSNLHVCLPPLILVLPILMWYMNSNLHDWLITSFSTWFYLINCPTGVVWVHCIHAF